MDEKMVNWITSVENGYGECTAWLELDEKLRSILEPVREMILRDKKNISELQINLKHTCDRMNFYKEALNSLPNPIFIKDEDTRFIFFNNKYQELFGMAGNSFIGKKVFDLEYLPIADRKKYQQEDIKMIQEILTVHYEQPFIFTDGKLHECLYWSSGFSVPTSTEKGLVGEIVDISKEKELSRDLEISMKRLSEANEKIEAASRTDNLTGLANRRVLQDRVSALISISKRHNFPLSVVMADLDNFKLINDKFGHILGDQVLKRFASIIRELCRYEDIPIRYGGEEFLIFLPMTELRQAESFAERICSVIRKEIILPDNKAVTSSFGVAQYKQDEELEVFLCRADNALYVAKNSGKNRVQSINS